MNAPLSYISCDESKFVFPPNWEQAIEIIIMGWNLFCIFTNYFFFFRRYIHKNMYSQTFPSGSVGRMSVSSYLEVWVQIRNIRIISFFIRSISIDVGGLASFVGFYICQMINWCRTTDIYGGSPSEWKFLEPYKNRDRQMGELKNA